MAETALNFGPDWIRALATGSTTTPSQVSSIPRYSLAEFRYGREEMLALLPKDMKVPKCLEQFPHLAREKFQMPLALIPPTEEEQRLWTRSVNSDAVLRASGKTGQGYSMSRPGRGGSVDRGRGRGRGGYYQRGLMHDDSEDGLPSFSRPKPVERSLSANEKDHRWDDRDRRFDRTYTGRGGIDDINLKQEMRGPNEYWRKYEKDDDGDWRSTGFRSTDKPGGRGSWRNLGDRDRRDASDRNLQNRNSVSGSKSGVSPLQRQNSQPSSWKEENQGNLPEWSVEETTESDAVGTFDSSGAFLETKGSEDASVDEIYASDDADEGISKQDSPEAKKESNKKTPKKSPSTSNKQTPGKKNSKTLGDAKNVSEKPVQSESEPSKNSSKNSPPKSSLSKIAENATIQNTVVEQQSSKEPDPVLNPQPVDVAKSTKTESVLLNNVKNSERVVSTPGTTYEDDAFAYHQKATENMVAQWTEEIEDQRVAPTSEDIHPVHHEKDTKWFYQDPQGEIQGPFNSPEMLEWFSAGYFTMSLMVRRNCDDKFSQLGELIKAWGRVPFMPGSGPPPVRAAPLPPTIAPPIAQPMVPNPATSANPTQLPKQDDPLRAIQQQLYQQHLMQQQLMMRQAQMTQLLATLKQQETFANLNSQQQQQILMQRFMAQQQLPRPNTKPVPDKSNLMDAVNPLSVPMLGLSLPPVMKNDLWQTASGSGTWPVNVNTTQPPGGSIWDVDLAKSEELEIEKKKKLLEEQERKAEELRLEQEREAEEKRKEEFRKQEEARIFQELQKQEEERKRLEELQRQQEVEQRHQEELKRLEQQRREEEEYKKQEELRRQEELKKELKRQEELKKLEELRKQEEEKRLAELRRKEEQNRQEELKRQEEKRKKEEMQKKIQMEKEREKQLELERQREALRQKELEREERLQKELKEREEIKRIAELKKSQGPVWGITNNQSNSQLSLADIQRFQEEKEKEEREEKLRQLAIQQQQQQQQQSMKQVQQSKNGLSWAKRANDCQPVVKSLIEIQQEEAERLAQLHRMQKPQAPAPPVNSNAGVWGNSSHLQKITAPPSWSMNNVSTSGFWDDALNTTQARKQSQKPANSDSSFPALVNPVQPANVTVNKNKNVRAKKDEDAVARLFGSHHKPTDEFTKWCTESISAMPSSVDVPTFVAFLKDIESPYEVYDYVKSYLGEGKEPREFAKQFLEKRSKFRNQAKQVPTEENTLWGPAPAITPPVNKTITPTVNDCDGNSNTRGKAKKRKNKMQKLDSSMLGFTVQPNPDRINAGEIDHIEKM